MNPFRIGEHVGGDYFADRETEVARVQRAMAEPGALLVYGPRRMGKSSVIRRAAANARANEPSAIVVEADLSTATSLFDVSARLLRSLYTETRSLRLRLEELLGGLAPRVSVTIDEHTGVPSISFGADRRSADEEAKRQALEAVFQRLDSLRQRTGRPVVVVLDEFQAIIALGGEAGEWHLRDLIQRHGELSYICAGSQESLIQEMIGPRRAFFKMFELLHLGPLEPALFAAWIEDRLGRSFEVAPGAAAAVLAAAAPRTQDVVQLARQVYFLASTGAAQPVDAALVERALADIVDSEAPLIARLWHELAAHQQDVLRVLSLGAEQLLSSEVRDRYGLPAPSSIQRAVDGLLGRGLIVRDTEGLRFDSPFIEHWVRRQVAPDIG
jgi:uncharacterized protein